jgi:DNA-binding NtrC family response regulator
MDASNVALIVEDEVFARLMAMQILLEDDYCVLEACDAAQALHVLDRNDDVSLLITDISMPGDLDGLALAHAVRDQHPAMRIILTSGYRPPEEAELPPGAAFLPKPYNSHSLKSLVHSMGWSSP